MRKGRGGPFTPHAVNDRVPGRARRVAHTARATLPVSRQRFRVRDERGGPLTHVAVNQFVKRIEFQAGVRLLNRTE